MVSARTIERVKRAQARSAEQKRRIEAGELLVCTARQPLAGTRCGGKPVYHADARPVGGTTRETPNGWVNSGGDIRTFTCPNCGTIIEVKPRYA